MQTYKKLNIEINEQINDIITAVQNDTKSRFLDIQLFNNGVAVDLTGHKVRVYGFKADKTNFWNDCVIEDAENGRILLELTNQILALADVVHMQIKIYNNEETEILSTQIFKVWGTKNLYNEEAVESSNEYGSVVQLFQDVFEVRMQIAQILEHIGEPGEKAEELQKKTLFEQLEWLIDFSQKNSVGSLGEKIDTMQKRVEFLERKEKGRGWIELPNKKFTFLNKQLSSSTQEHIFCEIDGSGELVTAAFQTNAKSGKLDFKIQIDDDVIFNAEINYEGYTTTSYFGLINTEFTTFDVNYPGNITYLYYDTSNSKWNTSGINLTDYLRCANYLELSSEKISITAKNFISTNIPLAIHVTKNTIPFSKKLKITVKAIEQSSSVGISSHIIYNLNE